ncbi:MAG: methyltransferase domain-containing protein [Candidatus Latescibacteria bacterium]|jgi:ubiquinone/menaquinone biosynthesis C-methylase UbiE|nr:methyltransferase domain-containing protein [Candidatus Latescibacterota bacterium]
MSAHAQRVRSRFDHEAENWNAQYQNANPYSIYAHNLLLRQRQTEALVDDTRGRLLELGCGAGNVLLNISAQKSIKPFGADFSLGMLTRAQQNANNLKLKLPLFNADATQLPLASNSFETVICLGVLEYIPNFPDVIAECMRILKPKGQFIVSIPNATSPFIRIDDTLFTLKNAITHTLLPTGIRSWIKRKLLGREDKPYFRHKKQRFSPLKFQQQLSDQGFQIIEQKFHTYGFGFLEGTPWNVNLSEYITRRTPHHPNLEKMGWTHILKAVKQ